MTRGDVSAASHHDLPVVRPDLRIFSCHMITGVRCAVSFDERLDVDGRIADMACASCAQHDGLRAGQVISVQHAFNRKSSP